MLLLTEKIRCSVCGKHVGYTSREGGSKSLCRVHWDEQKKKEEKFTKEECNESFNQNRNCIICSIVLGKPHKHTLEEINEAELKREKLLESTRKGESGAA